MFIFYLYILVAKKSLMDCATLQLSRTVSWGWLVPWYHCIFSVVCFVFLYSGAFQVFCRIGLLLFLFLLDSHCSSECSTVLLLLFMYDLAMSLSAVLYSLWHLHLQVSLIFHSSFFCLYCFSVSFIDPCIGIKNFLFW